MSYETVLTAFYGGYDVSDILQAENFPNSFLVTNDIFGDPTPGVYKYLEVKRGEESVVVGEGDYVIDLANIFTSIPSSSSIAPAPSVFVQDLYGLKIGPSWGLTPLKMYSRARRMDNMILNGEPGPFDVCREPGEEFPGDIVDMSFIPREKYDFVLAANVLQSLANPLKALVEVNQIMMYGGHVCLFLPKKELMFNHNRPVTAFEELKQHFDDQRTELDVMDHVTEELLDMYDFEMDPGAQNRLYFTERCRDNYNNRLFHVHVFDFELMKQCLQFAGFKPVYYQLQGYNQIIGGRKVSNPFGPESIMPSIFSSSSSNNMFSTITAQQQQQQQQQSVMAHNLSSSQQRQQLQQHTAAMMSPTELANQQEQILRRYNGKRCPFCNVGCVKDENCSLVYCGLYADAFHPGYGCGKSFCFACGKKYCGTHYDAVTGQQLSSYRDHHDETCCAHEPGFTKAEYCRGGHNSHCERRW